MNFYEGKRQREPECNPRAEKRRLGRSRLEPERRGVWRHIEPEWD